MEINVEGYSGVSQVSLHCNKDASRNSSFTMFVYAIQFIPISSRFFAGDCCRLFLAGQTQWTGKRLLVGVRIVILTTFADFDDADLSLPAQTFENYKSKYLDIHDVVKRDQGKNKTSIIDDVDFELSLIHRDEINVAYILNLLMTLSKLPPWRTHQTPKRDYWYGRRWNAVTQ